MVENNNVNLDNENVFTKPAHTMSTLEYFCRNVGNALWGICRWIVGLLVSMVLSLAGFFKKIGVGIYKACVGFVRFIKRLAHKFKYNDASGRASYFVFGTSALANKQYVAGVCYVLFEIAYVVLFALFGAKAIGMLSTLGTVGPHEDPDAEFAELVLGDNSIMILIFGLLWIFSIGVFFYIWNKNINNGYTNYRAKNLKKFEKYYDNHLEFNNELEAVISKSYSNHVSLNELDFENYKQLWIEYEEKKCSIKNSDSDSAEKKNQLSQLKLDFKNKKKEFKAASKERRNKQSIKDAEEKEANYLLIDKYLEDFKKTNLAANNIQEGTPEYKLFMTEYSYARYLLVNSFKHAYSYQITREKQANKVANKKDFYRQLLSFRNARKPGYIKNLKERYDENIPEIKDFIDTKIEIFDNKTFGMQSKYNKNVSKMEHKLHEIDKTHSSYIEMQITQNGEKYGKLNNYYKHLAELESNIKFYTNYSKLLECYVNSVSGSDDKNTENANLRVTLFDEKENKISNTRNKFDVIRKKRADLLDELNEARMAYKTKISQIELQFRTEVAEASTVEEKEAANERKVAAFLEAKAVLVDATTIVNRKLNDLPSEKNVKALEKEEIKESIAAYKRDVKYLNTKYTPVSYALEQVTNMLIVDYKFDYTTAIKFTKKLFVKVNKKQTVDQNAMKGYRALTPQEVADALREEINAKDSYVANHPDKYDVKFEGFKEFVKSLFNEKFHVTILALPVCGILFFTIMPLLFSIVVAFTNYSLGHVPPTQLFTWYGWENFKTIFNPSPDSIYAYLPATITKTFGWTIAWAFIATFSNYILGIIVALMINKDGIKFKKLWRTIFVTTIAIPQFISLLSIGTLLNDGGALAEVYRNIHGVRLGFGSMGTADKVLMTKTIIILVNVWVGIPYTILSTTGILLNIPKDLYESSKVDGAGTFTQFTKITMPYILFVTGPYLITQFIGNINNFNVIFFLTGGKPNVNGSTLPLGQTDLLITFIYKIVTSTNNPQYGIASTVGILVFIICSFISIVMYNKTGAVNEEDQFQ